MSRTIRPQIYRLLEPVGPCEKGQLVGGIPSSFLPESRTVVIAGSEGAVHNHLLARSLGKGRWEQLVALECACGECPPREQRQVEIDRR